MPGYINTPMRRSFRTPLKEDKSNTPDMLPDIQTISSIRYVLDHNTLPDDSTQHAAEADHDNIGHPTPNNPLTPLALFAGRPAANRQQLFEVCQGRIFLTKLMERTGRPVEAQHAGGRLSQSPIASGWKQNKKSSDRNSDLVSFREMRKRGKTIL